MVKPVNLTLLDNDIRDRIATHEAAVKARPEDFEAAAKLYNLRRYYRPLLELVRSAQQQRSRFDPFNLIDVENPCDHDLMRYFNLDSKGESRPFAGVGVPSTLSMKAAPATGEFLHATHAPDDRLPAALSDPEGFFNQLFSGDEIAWRNAIEQEAERLNGHVLDNASFQSLLDRVCRAPRVVSVRWLEQLEPYLSADQLVALYRESKLLQRLNDAIQGAQPS